jgi:hypothetical protein
LTQASTLLLLLVLLVLLLLLLAAAVHLPSTTSLKIHILAGSILKKHVPSYHLPILYENCSSSLRSLSL